MTVEPCDGLTYAVEDDLMGNPQIYLVPIETTVGGSPQAMECIGEFVRNRILLAIHVSGEKDSKHSNHKTDCGHYWINMDGIRLTVPCHKLSEGDESGNARHSGKED